MKHRTRVAHLSPTLRALPIPVTLSLALTALRELRATRGPIVIQRHQADGMRVCTYMSTEKAVTITTL